MPGAGRWPLGADPLLGGAISLRPLLTPSELCVIARLGTPQERLLAVDQLRGFGPGGPPADVDLTRRVLIDVGQTAPDGASLVVTGHLAGTSSETPLTLDAHACHRSCLPERRSGLRRTGPCPHLGW